MIEKISKFIFVLGCLLALLFLLFVASLPSIGVLIKPTPSILTLIVFGGYCWIMLAFIFSFFCASSELIGKPFFWRSLTPSIIGLPIVAWGIMHVESFIDIWLAICSFMVSVVFLWVFNKKIMKPVIFKVLPIVVIVCFFVFLDIKGSWFFYVATGGFFTLFPFLKFISKSV